ncbi:MAG: hypothetical protein Q4A55_03495 [Aerococcus sp.]|nr:hypothetical protein [Aerococcus sp.]
MSQKFEGRQKEAGFNLSWGAIFAGVVTFIALVLTLSLIGSALGFGQFNPTQPNPFAGVGTGQLIWLIVELIIAFLGAGFVAGATARRMGHLHGFLTWATSLIAVVVLLTWLAGAALSAATNAAGSVLNATGQTVGTVAQSAGDAVTSGVKALADNINVDNSDLNQLNSDVKDVLKDTDVKELQPEYLSDQLNGATDEITQAAKDVVVNPDNADKIFSDLRDKLTKRVDSISENVDRQAVANAVAKNSDLSQSEAEKATDNIVNGYEKAAKTARDEITKAADSIDQTQKDLSQKIDQVTKEAKEGTEDAANAVSKGSIWAFVGLVIGAILSSVGGTLGVNYATRTVNEDRA